MYLGIVNRIWRFYIWGSKLGFSLRYWVDFRVRHETPEEGLRTHSPKRCEYNNKDEVNGPNIFSNNDMANIVLSYCKTKFWMVSIYDPIFFHITPRHTHTHTHTHIYIYIYIRGAYDKSPDFFRMGIWNCRRLLKIQYVIAIHLMRWLTIFFMISDLAGIRIHPTKAWLSELVNFKNTIWHFRRTICNKILFLNLEKVPQKRMECFRLLFDHLAWIEHQFLSGIRDSRKPGSLWGIMRGVGGVRKSIRQSWLAKRLGLGLLCWGFKGVQEDSLGRGQHSSNWVSGISTRTMHQFTTPSALQTIWPRWASTQFLSLPIVETLLLWHLVIP